MYVRPGYPDVVYFVKPGEENEELKYSLRSLKNLNHGHVFIVGYKPSWVSKAIIHIPTEQVDGKKYENVKRNWETALGHPQISEDFILMNDDFYIMQPTKNVPVLRRKKNIEHYIELFSKIDPDSYYVNSMKQTREYLRSLGIQNISSYELHVPMVINKTKMRALMNQMPATSHKRTVYGNYYNLGGERIADVKIIRDDQDISFNQQFLSTIDGSFEDGKVGDFLRKKFAKVLVFAHANDPDGLLSVILAQLAFPEVDYLLTNNPQADILEYIAAHEEQMNQYDFVIVSDIYPGKPVLERLPHVYWFDHKQNSLDKIKQHKLELPNAVIAVELDGRPTSGSELFYRWLLQNDLLDTSAANFVEYIRQIDTWDFE